MSVRREDNTSLRPDYSLHLEIGLVLSLSVLVVAVNVDFATDESFNVRMEKQETVEMREIRQTEQETKPPPPPRPPVPVEVPNNQVVEQQQVNFDASLDMDERLNTEQGPPVPSDDDEGEEQQQEDEIFIAVEEKPELIGGMAALQKAVDYPEMAENAGIEGRVIVQFVVNEEGNVDDPRVIRGVHQLLDEAAIEAVRAQKFKPGKQRGRSVKVQMSLPVAFTLREK